MYKYRKVKPSLLHVNDSVEGESIEVKVQRMIKNKEQIEDTAPLIYTEKSEGVKAGYDVRTDRFEVAVEATDMIHRDHAAKGEGTMKIVPKDDDDSSVDGGEATSVDGTD